MKSLVLSILLSMCVALLGAQTIDFAASVSFTYDGQDLETVLDDLSDEYGVKFSYSRQLIPMDMEVYVTVEDMSFFQALDELFDGTAIIYGFIGNQLVLSIDPHLRDLLQQQEMQILEDEPIASLEPVFIPRERYNVNPLNDGYAGFEPGEPDVDPNVFSREYIRYESDRLMRDAERANNAFRAQITLVPPVQAISSPYSTAPVNFSFNVLVGVNDNIEGFEMGGLANITRGDITGFQFAGLANAANQSLFGMQMAGVTNISRIYSAGVQMAGVTNIASRGGDLVQITGVSNIAGGHVLGQVSGVLNRARYVDGVQISGFLNVAHKATAQIGLINVADSSDFSFGLLSFIRSGYNSIEIAGEDVLHANMNIRLGSHGFYNILHVSSTYDASSWALGYGVGTAIRTGSKGHFVQLELLSRHVNEKESWTNDLNLLNQFNIFWDLHFGRHFSLTFGPTFNVMVSKLYDEDALTYGSQLPNYTMFDETWQTNNNRPVNIKGWLGFHLGARYNF